MILSWLADTVQCLYSDTELLHNKFNVENNVSLICSLTPF